MHACKPCQRRHVSASGEVKPLVKLSICPQPLTSQVPGWPDDQPPQRIPHYPAATRWLQVYLLQVDLLQVDLLQVDLLQVDLLLHPAS
jgi:hypothetical protein